MANHQLSAVGPPPCGILQLSRGQGRIKEDPS
jgi:hypothetical protein